VKTSPERVEHLVPGCQNSQYLWLCQKDIPGQVAMQAMCEEALFGFLQLRIVFEADCERRFEHVIKARRLLELGMKENVPDIPIEHYPNANFWHANL